MAKIRAYNFLDSYEIKKMVSLIQGNAQVYAKRTLPLLPLDLIHRFLPISLKFLPEAFVSIEEKKIIGLISLKPNKGNWHKWKISRLFLYDNSYYAGVQLVDYVISTYGARGVNTFIVNIESSQEEVLQLFSKGCGFKFCSFEQLWQMKSIRIKGQLSENIHIRPLKNSDTKAVCDIYNEEIYSQFRNSLCKSPNEFKESFFKGIEEITSLKYVIENSETSEITGLIIIKTEDNFNYLVELSLSSFHDADFNDLLTFATLKISKRCKNYNLFVINKKYKQNSIMFENYLSENNFELKQTQSVLVKDYFKNVESSENITIGAICFTNIKGKPAYNTSFLKKNPL